MKYLLYSLAAFITMSTVTQAQPKASAKAEKTPFIWEGANLYFLITDRFNNGDKTNDVNFGRNEKTGKLRGFEGGDLKGITQKIKEGYFTKLGINAIWITPIVEQIHGGVDEGTGLSYGFHGYWAKDWTALDPNFGTEKDLQEFVDVAHAYGIRVLLDAVINHTGPVTEKDPVWPDNWVRTGEVCDYTNYENTTACSLVANLPDIITESNDNVDLPPVLVEKWKKEGRYDQQVKELDDFFKHTGYPRAPRYYIIKWLRDYVRKYGIDGYRCDTAKHLNEDTWGDFKSHCNAAFADWKRENPEKVLDDNDFYMIGEVYGYGIGGGKDYNFGDRKVNYFDYGFNNLINFQFRWDAEKSYEEIFSFYSDKLNNDLEGVSVLNYLSSHDDGNPFDPNRKKGKEAGTKLLLTPGISQIYYGDESSRSLVIEGTQGDATLRSFMNWDEVATDKAKADVLAHWQKLGTFRKKHVSVGAGIHKKISDAPYVFSRGFDNGKVKDKVVIGLDLAKGNKKIKVASIFENGTELRDAYSGKTVTVKYGFAELDTEFDIVLLEKK